MSAEVIPLHMEHPVPDDGLLGAAQVLSRVPISYRQLEFWSATRRVKFTAPGGSGHNRRYPESEVLVMALALECLRMGFTLDTSLALSRRVHEHKDVALESLLAELREMTTQAVTE